MNEKTKVDLSVIIVCYRGWEKLRKCLSSLVSLNDADFASEVIVVDNRSDDVTIEEIKKNFPSFRFISNSVNGGFGNGCNLGAQNAEGEYLLFLNPDTEASAKAIGDLIRFSKTDSSLTILSCRQINSKGKESKAVGVFPEYYNLTGLMRSVFRKRNPENDNSEVIYPDWVSGSVMLIKKDSFLKIKGFDDDFWMYYEDVDICKRVRNVGGKIALCRNITIIHNHGGSSRVNLKTASLTKTEVITSRHVYISKHKEGLERLLIHIFLVINNIITNLLSGMAGLIFFFIPKAFLRSHILVKMLKYYLEAAFRLTWISKRSVNS